MPLTHLKVERAKPKEKQYKLADERGMYLLIHPKGGKWWRLDYRYQGKRKTLSLGTYPDVSIKVARKKPAKRSVLAKNLREIEVDFYKADMKPEYLSHAPTHTFPHQPQLNFECTAPQLNCYNKKLLTWTLAGNCCR